MGFWNWLWGNSNKVGSLKLIAPSTGIVEGATLSARLSDPDGIRKVTYRWQEWGDDGKWHNIAGATGRTYKVDADTAGEKIRVVARYTDGDGTFTALNSSAVRALSKPVDKDAAGVLGIASSSTKGFVEGATLTARLSDADGVRAASYRWQELGSDGRWHDIAGANKKTLTLGHDVGGEQIRVVANYLDGDRHASTLTSKVTAVDVNRAGSLQVTSSSTDGYVEGATLTARVTDADGVGTVSYKWQAKGSDGVWRDIAGATSKTYTLADGDGGKEIKAVATYTDTQKHKEAPTTSVTARDAAAPDPDPDPTPLDGDMLIGINLAGAEFGNNVPGTLGTDYRYPSHAQIDYFAAKGHEVLRLPFLWERLQKTDNGPLDARELAQIDDFVSYANSKGLKVILDPHNYGYRDGSLIGSAETPYSEFADLWGKLATHFKGNPDVIFGLMNEPHDHSAAQWLPAVNAAIAAIRDAGATQEIFVPGTYWDHAYSWTTSDNARIIGAGVKDPLNNYTFEVHEYFDANASGKTTSVVSEHIGVERVTAITKWAEATGNKLFLGEFAAGTDVASLRTLDNMLDYMQQHADVWEGATIWGGGNWSNGYVFNLNPVNGVDKPQLDILGQHIDPQNS